MKQQLIIKLGGSILSPSLDKLFDVQAALNIKTKLMQTDYQFIIITGGGTLARSYQKLVQKNSGDERDVHWIGTAACNLNATMLRAVFNDNVVDEPLISKSIIEDTKLEFEEKFLCVGAVGPGHSSDYDAVLIAVRSGAKSIISMKNVNGVYTSDPKNNPNAKKINKLTWQEYFNIIGNKTDFEPGGHFPVDPKASQLAMQKGISIFIMDGRNLDNLEKAIQFDTSIGTLIGD